MLWALLLVGCGGSIEQGPDDGSGGQTDKSTSTGAGASVNSHGSGGASGTRLGDCKPGTARSLVSSCAWYAGQTCYPSLQAACNCACPADAAAVTCVSDFPEEGIATEVYCVER